MEITIQQKSLAASTGWRVFARNQRADYLTTLAATPEEVAEAQALRFEAFNLERAEGLVSSFLTGRDQDPFDKVCQHLIVREVATSKVVGTYRLQTGEQAHQHLGYYSETEFDLVPFESYRTQILELGRACVHAEHRNLRVLASLWRGIVGMAIQRRSRYLIGCSSLSTTNPGEGLALYRRLAERYLAPLELRTLPHAAMVCSAPKPLPPAPRIPKLLAAYLSFGAWIAGPPSMDREFGTVDFLTVMDLKKLNPVVAPLYLGAQWQELFVNCFA